MYSLLFALLKPQHMKTYYYHLLVTAAGKLIQEHAFDHLSDEKLLRMNRCKNESNNRAITSNNYIAENELLQLCIKANLYFETTSFQSMQKLLSVMNVFENFVMPDNSLEFEVIVTDNTTITNR